MAHDGTVEKRYGKREGEPDSTWVWRMIGLKRTGMAEPNTLVQTLWRDRGQGNFRFPSLADHTKQDWQLDQGYYVESDDHILPS